MSREKQRKLEEINRPKNEELFNNLEKQYQEVFKVKAESDEIDELTTVLYEANHKKSVLDYRWLATEAYNAGYRKQSEGEWKDQYNGKYANPIYVCSLCGKGTLLTPYINELNNMEMTQALSPFCPNCGAKMKGGAE